jgi:hypothetical protein
MSVQAIAWAFAQNLPCCKKFVLVALANFASADGECWPSQSTIANLCGITRTHVNVLLGELEASGHLTRIQRVRNDGAQTSNLYRLACPTISCGGVIDVDTPLSTKGTPGVFQVNTFKKEPLLEPSNNICGAPAPPMPGTIGSWSESDFVTDDAKIRLTAAEIDELAHDLPSLTNHRGCIRQAFRNYAHLPPVQRMSAVRFYLLKKNEEAAGRADDKAKRRKADAKLADAKGERRAVYGDDFM